MKVAKPKYYDSIDDLPWEGTFEEVQVAGETKYVRIDLEDDKMIDDHNDPSFEPVEDEKEVERTETAKGEIPWVKTAVNLMGTREIKGRRSNNKIMGWAKNVGGWVKNYYKNDDIPWCGLFTDHLMRSNDISVNIKNPLSAREWNKFGMKATPCPGAIMVFSRRGGGHVGIYVSEDNTHYHILGGNQSNTVNVTKIAKHRFLGARWPKEHADLYHSNNKRLHKKFDGKVSHNEA